MKTMLNRRLSMLTFVLITVGVLLFVRLFSFQFDANLTAYFQNSANQSYRQLRDMIPDRGRIFDRNGELLATNAMDYDVGVSPRYVTDKAKPQTAHDLAAALSINEQTIVDALNQDT